MFSAIVVPLCGLPPSSYAVSSLRPARGPARRPRRGGGRRHANSEPAHGQTAWVQRCLHRSATIAAYTLEPRQCARSRDACHLLVINVKPGQTELGVRFRGYRTRRRLPAGALPELVAIKQMHDNPRAGVLAPCPDLIPVAIHLLPDLSACGESHRPTHCFGGVRPIGRTWGA